MHVTRFGALSALLAVVWTGLAAPAAHAEVGPGASPETVTASPLTTWQTNGTVWDVEVVGGVVYVGGNFTKVRPPGKAIGDSTEVTRNRLAAFNATTGALLSWAPSATGKPYTVPDGQVPDKDCTPLGSSRIECATVWSITSTPDKKSIVIGGDFTAVNGKVRAGLAAFSTTTGALDTTFKPSVSGRVQTVAASGSAVYVGGNVTKAGSEPRTGLAAFDFPSGALRPFAPDVRRSTNVNILPGVRTIALSPDASRLVVGGGFDALAGRELHGLGAVDAQTGAAVAWNSNSINPAAAVTSLTVVGDQVYSTADAAGSESEGVIAFDVATGNQVWYDSCRGASHSMAVVRGVVYVGSHSHDCGAMEGGFNEQYSGYGPDDRRRYTLRAEVPSGAGAKLLSWSPKTDDGNGARAMATDGNVLWVGGEFTNVDNTPQQGLTRFSFLGSGVQDHKPLTPAAPIVSSTRPGQIDVSWKETEDPDNRSLTYQLIRDQDTGHPVHEVTSASPPWLQGWMHFTDDVADGSSHTYDVRAIDPLGTPSRRSVGVTVTAATQESTLRDLAKRDQAAVQLSFESTTAGRYADSITGTTATPGNGVAATAGSDTSGKAVALSGAPGGAVVHDLQQYSPRSSTVEALFKTTTNRGGSLVSIGSSTSTSSGSGSDTNIVYMSSSGRLNVGLRPDKTRSSTAPWELPATVRTSVATSTRYNDGAWHHLAVTFEPTTGTRIFVDGALAAEDPTMRTSRSVNGYLRVGGDTVAGWADIPASPWFAGAVDEVAFYRYPLSSTQVRAHADTALARLTAPTGLKATVKGPDSVDLTWRAVAGATGYQVKRDGTSVGTVETNAFSDTGLEPRTTHTYTVSATSGAQPGPASSEASATTTAPRPVTLLQSGQDWRYDVSGRPDADWTGSSYDDARWPGGPSQLGHGEGDEATAITPFMPDGTTRRITTYFRTTFEAPTGPDVTRLSLRYKVDDGAILYLNGKQVLRDNLPAGDVGPETKASTWAADDGQTWRTATIPVSSLTSGTNVLAVEVHQNERSSLDLTWDAELTAAYD